MRHRRILKGQLGMQIFQGINSLDDVLKRIKEHQNQLLAILLSMTLIVGGTYGYLYYKKSREENAYRALVTALEYFDAPIKKADASTIEEDLSFLNKKEFKTEDEKWNKVESIFDTEYQAHRGSGLAPLFLVYRSQALAHLKKLSQAIDVLRSAVSQMKNNQVRDYFNVKLALMLLDSPQKEEEGLEMLKQVSQKESNVVHDMSLYHLGEYYWHKRNFNEARNYWNQLLLKYSEDTKTASPWVSVAKNKLRLIDSDVD